ncbi:MAG TPA: ribose 5-phosphate isomerase B [Candidatus Saccharimonadales bacterium]|nr:ribose 5-phosphate isomerase B [Candidatus Saccharimonadales bacterium]
MYHKIIYIGSDHGGFELKARLLEYLSKVGYRVADVGPLVYEPGDDYPDFVAKLCARVLKDRSRGIMICKSGVGASIAANKVNGIYAALCWNPETAKQSREHLDANVLCLSGMFLGRKEAEEMVRTWLESQFEGGRHIRRLNKIKAIEKAHAGVKHDSARRSGR